ncbi:hypothetical protein BH23ACT11_BH23ACT11_26230 [soil metagenome]
MPASTWVAGEINSQLQSLIALVAVNVLLVSATIGVFWAGVIVARLLKHSVSFSLSPLGFARPRRGALVGVGVGVAVGLLAVFVGGMVNLLTKVAFERLGYSTESRVQQEFMRSMTGWIQDQPEIAIPSIIAVVVLFGPFAEELIFRGGIFNGLHRLGLLIFRKIAGKRSSAFAAFTSFALAALLSSAFFASLHLEPVLLPSLLLLAVALCWLFRWSESLIPPFVAHATFNSFATVLIILSGLDLFELPI